MAWQPEYVTSDELKAFMRIPLTDTQDDAAIDFAIAGASRAVDEHCGRQFGVLDAAEERLYTPQRDRRRLRHRPRWVVHTDDLMTETDLTVKVEPTGTEISNYALRPPNAVKNGDPWTEIVIDSEANVVLYGDEDEVAVTAIWGWTSVPEAVKTATLLQASRLFSRRTSPFGVAGSPDTGSELRLLAKVDPDVAVVLEPFARRGWVA